MGIYWSSGWLNKAKFIQFKTSALYKPWILAFSFFKFESLASTLLTASPLRVIGKESHFLASFASGPPAGRRLEGFIS
jgi:hypothetical protein